MECVPCIRCNKPLSNIFDHAENQPYEGTTFQSHGHYGSTAFDPMDGQYIEINVCDACLIALSATHVMQGRDRRPVMCEGSVIGFEILCRPLIRWNPELGSDMTDVIHVERDEIGEDAITFTHEGRRRIEWLPGAELMKEGK